MSFLAEVGARNCCTPLLRMPLVSSRVSCVIEPNSGHIVFVYLLSIDLFIERLRSLIQDTPHLHTSQSLSQVRLDSGCCAGVLEYRLYSFGALAALNRV